MDSIIFVSKDLLFYSRVDASARAAGLHCRMVHSLEAAQDIDPGHVRFLLFDLPHMAANDQSFADWLAMFDQAKSIAFGPHVERQLLDDAQTAGVDRVLTRNQFNSLLPSLFQ